ncbi:MAG: serine/threonine-protein kinase [Candidatus Obscuribacterales bacterium]|nr:serine/threonine-protein kinase [Candidatus Obscuribacterales bacterium]
MNPEKQKEKQELELICPDCRLPLCADKPRTDVTRYLAESSRCQCRRYSSSSEEEGIKAGSDKNKPLRIEVKVAFSLEEAADIIGERFELISFLGQGGMGSVYKVKDRASNKIFAVKLLNPQLVDDELSVKRFEHEAKAAMRLTHPHLAAVYEFGIGKNGSPFLLMDYLEGKSLEQVLQEEKSLDYKRALDIFIQITEAMSYAHLKGVIHRDIKPHNIMITKPGNGIEFAKLFDFGIAKVMPNRAIDFTQDMEQTGELFGSPLYMAPEQCKGLAVDERTDIYAFACVMYKTLSGKHPFDGKNFVDTVVKIITQEAVPLRKAGTDTNAPADLEEVIARCLSKEADERYKNAELLQADLERIRDGKAITAFKRKTPKSKSRQPSTRRAFAEAIGIAGLVLAVLATMNFFRSSFQTNTNPPSIVNMDPYKDAERLDQLSYTYFTSGKYEQAIPLLEFGIKTYKENGRKAVGVGREDNYLAENYAHLGKCYLMLKQYDKAVPNFRESLRMFRQWGNYSGGMMSEAVNDYAAVLRGLGKNEEADDMLKEFAKLNNLRTIP